MTDHGAIAICILCSVSVLAQTGVPNLSGVWKRNAEKSKPSRKGPDEMWVKIDQDGTQIHMAMRVRSGNGVENQDFTFRAGLEENKNTMHGAPMTGQTRWEGGALLIDSVASFGTNHDLRLNERWTLSADGQTLSFVERHQFASEPAAEDLYVFDRMPPAAWQQEEKPKLAEETFKNIQVLKGPSRRAPDAHDAKLRARTGSGMRILPRSQRVRQGRFGAQAHRPHHDEDGALDQWRQLQRRQPGNVLDMPSRQHQAAVVASVADGLLLEHLFNLADFLLHFPGDFFALAFILQIGIARDLSRFLFDFPFHFMQRAFDLIVGARFHHGSPLFSIFFQRL
jgi:hypothetical protein